uniref:Rho guanine nucleotide exchange factor 12 n=1 Tax=Anoplophora glabripennis TaxID=217634 RepID=V5I8L3_ANOGL
MWSKQADTRNSNKNMTSFKNKITNRKRRNSKSRNPANDSVDSVETDLNSSSSKQSEDKKKQPKPSKNRGRNRSKKDTNAGADKTNVQDSKNCKESVSCGSNGDVTLLIDKDLETADVVLRNPNSDLNKRNVNNTLKRYSDSFVIENNGQNENGRIKLKENDLIPPVLTRAVSGFFVIDHARKAKRFSDLFRPSSTMKLSGSTESLKINNGKNTGKGENNGSVPTRNDVDKATKKLNQENNLKNKQKKKTENSSVKTASTKSTTKKEPVNTEPSYLKRVKSRIYKSKSDGATAQSKTDEVDAALKSKKLKPKKNLEINGRIPEDEVAVLTPNGLRKSLTHFDFRLTRQTSNLERIRPKAFGSKKSTDLVDETNISNEKPVLAKAKSSSAINLNLLRTRRNKILEQVAARCGAKDVQKEFDFIAFGSVNNVASLGSQTSLHKLPSWLHIHKEEQGDVKQGQPVSRSGSDRRPDAVREEGLKVQDSPSTTDSTHDASEKAEVSTPDSTTSLPATGSKRRINSNINRSESVKEQSEKRKQRRNISDPSHNTTGGDVDLDRQPGLSNTDSGSSSNSSISCNGRLSESPSNSVDTVGQTGPSRGNLDSDSDMDVEAEPWQSFVPPEELRNLPPHEKKRQDVINELFHTEGSHVRNLKVLYKIFYKKLQESQILKPEELNLMFPNIKEMLDLHTEINKAMRRRRKEDSIVKEIGDILVNMFDDRQGESLKKAAANFCERQQLALEFIKRRRERDSKFEPCCRNAKRSDSAGDCLFRVSFPRKCRGCRSTPFSSRDSSTV